MAGNASLLVGFLIPCVGQPHSGTQTKPLRSQPPSEPTTIRMFTSPRSILNNTTNAEFGRKTRVKRNKQDNNFKAREEADVPSKGSHFPASTTDSPGAEHGVVSRKDGHVLMTPLIDWRRSDTARRLPRRLICRESKVEMWSEIDERTEA